MVFQWFVAFLLTLLFEALPVLLLLKASEPSRSRRLTLLFFANLSSHPMVWFVFPALPLPYATTLTLSELWAFGIEVVFYFSMVRRLSWRLAGLVSVVANVVSFLVGVLVFWVIWAGLGG